MDLQETIRHEGSKWVLYTKDGAKVLGSFGTKAEAEKRERQIQFFKHQQSREDNMAAVEKTETSLRFRQSPPGKYKRFRVGKPAPGIEFVYGVVDAAGGEKVEVQSVVFDKEKFTLAQAKKWLADHDMKMGESAVGISAVGGAFVHDERIYIGVIEEHSERVSMGDMDDDDLRAMRAKMVAKRSALRDEHAGLEDGDKYSTAAGRQLLDDADYYSRMISGIEYEMQSRCLEL